MRSELESRNTGRPNRKRHWLSRRLRGWATTWVMKMNPENEIAVQRLVDNELNEQEVAEFLQRAESDSQLWRMATLAFLEERVWSSVACETSRTTTALSTNDAPTPTVATPAELNGAGTNVDRELSPRTHSLRWKRYAGQLLVTAALVFLALNIALRFNPVEPDSGKAASADNDSTNGQLAESDRSADPAMSLENNQNLVSAEPYQLQLDDSTTVPLVYTDDESMLRAMQDERVQVDPTFRRQMLDFGYQVKPRIRYMSGQADDGRSFIVPVQSFRLQLAVQ